MGVFIPVYSSEIAYILAQNVIIERNLKCPGEVSYFFNAQLRCELKEAPLSCFSRLHLHLTAGEAAEYTI
jgi:hypothetical protein